MKIFDISGIIIAVIAAIGAIIVAIIQRFSKVEKSTKDRILLPENAVLRRPKTWGKLPAILIWIIICLILGYVSWKTNNFLSTLRAISSPAAIQVFNSVTIIPQNSAQATAQALTEEAVLVFSAPNMVELKPVQGGIAFSFATVKLRNLIIEAIFQNPNSKEWSYGFSFRRKGEATDNFDLFDVYIRSDKKWFYNRQQKTYGQEQISTHLNSGVITDLDVAGNGANKIKIIVKDNTAFLFINDSYIDTLDVSLINDAGDVVVVTNLDSSQTLYDAPTFVNSFRIWSLEP